MKVKCQIIKKNPKNKLTQNFIWIIGVLSLRNTLRTTLEKTNIFTKIVVMQSGNHRLLCKVLSVMLNYRQNHNNSLETSATETRGVYEISCCFGILYTRIWEKAGHVYGHLGKGKGIVKNTPFIQTHVTHKAGVNVRKCEKCKELQCSDNPTIRARVSTSTHL